MKRINQWLINLLVTAVKIIYKEKIDQFLTSIGEKTQWQLVTDPVIVKVKKGKRKYYLFEYMDGDGQHVIEINRHGFSHVGKHMPVTMKTDVCDCETCQCEPEHAEYLDALSKLQ